MKVVEVNGELVEVKIIQELIDNEADQLVKSILKNWLDSVGYMEIEEIFEDHYFCKEVKQTKYYDADGNLKSILIGA